MNQISQVNTTVDKIVMFTQPVYVNNIEPFTCIASFFSLNIFTVVKYVCSFVVNTLLIMRELVYIIRIQFSHFSLLLIQRSRHPYCKYHCTLVSETKFVRIFVLLLYYWLGLGYIKIQKTLSCWICFQLSNSHKIFYIK